MTETVPYTEYLARQLLHTAQLITQSKHVGYLSQSVLLVLCVYCIATSRDICSTTTCWCMPSEVWLCKLTLSGFYPEPVSQNFSYVALPHIHHNSTAHLPTQRKRPPIFWCTHTDTYSLNHLTFQTRSVHDFCCYEDKMLLYDYPSRSLEIFACCRGWMHKQMVVRQSVTISTNAESQYIFQCQSFLIELFSMYLRPIIQIG